MLELHGWITIRESFKEENENKNLAFIIDKIKDKIEDLYWETNLLDLRYCNGIPNISISLFTNRVNQEFEDVMNLLKFICQVADGSYGIIYLYDDESFDSPEHFQVYTISKGEINKTKDTLLSPVIPTIYLG